MDLETTRQFRASIRRFERVVAKQVTTCCEGVSLASCHALLEIDALGQTTNGQVAKNLSSDPSNMSRTVDALVTSGLVKRSSHPSDRRVVLLSLTEAGRLRCNAIHQANDEYYARVLDRLPVEERSAILDHFNRLVAALEDAGESSSCCGNGSQE